jgi:hypothetical protein
MRFEVVADFVVARFPEARYVADVAGGQGMLARLLAKRHNLEAEVVDPRGWRLKGVGGREEEYTAAMADYYDLVIGLHPDQALREVVLSAERSPVVVVPCCNFWTRERKLGRSELLAAIGAHHESRGGACDHVELAFRGPHNHALVLTPAPAPAEPAPPLVGGSVEPTPLPGLTTPS